MVKAYIKKSRLGYYNVGYIIGKDKIHLRKFRNKKSAESFYEEKKKIAKGISKK